MSLLSTNISSVFLKSCLYNASGCLCVSKEDLLKVYNSNSGAVISKSCTFSPREGNPKPRYFENSYGSINSMGMPNKGYRFYTYMSNYLLDLGDSKPYIISVSGLDFDELLTMLSYIDNMVKRPEQLVEVNLSCPNIPGEAQVSYDFKKMDNCLKKIFSNKYKKIKIGLKLSPYFDPSHILEVSNIFKKYSLHFLTCINSLGNGIIINPETDKTSIVPKKGLGGVGGLYCKPIALSNVFQFYKHLGDKLTIIGCGGVQSGQDAYEHILCGASVVQIGTQLVREGPNCFTRIEKELKDILIKKKYKSVKELCGSIHEL